MGRIVNFETETGKPTPKGLGNLGLSREQNLKDKV